MQSVGQESIQLIEFALRFNSDDGDGTTTLAILTEMLERETSYHNTSWKKLDGIHGMMMAVATEQEDWITAIRHLDERWKLQDGVGTAEEKLGLCCQYVLCYARLRDLESAWRWVTAAVNVARTMDEGSERMKELLGLLMKEAPEVVSYMGAQIFANPSSQPRI